MKKVLFWSMASHGTGISGGDRIFMEFARRWSKTLQIAIVTWKEGEEMMDRNNLHETEEMKFHRLQVPKIIQKSFFACYIYRIILSTAYAFFGPINPESSLLYTSSEFWMDALPGLILKVRYPKILWVATWYQTAPSPLRGFSDGSRASAYRGNAIVLWLSQLVIKPVMVALADVILVNNDLEKNSFPTKHTIVVLGAVDVQTIDNYQKKHINAIKYSAVFQGRFHPQKGVVELVEIWRYVAQKNNKARLAMIGDGPLRSEVEQMIKKFHLENNVELFGFVFDGAQKFKIFSQSEIVVHPAFFDSGGMATAEAMAFGLPAVGFDLPAYKSYYPVGMIVVPQGELIAFADAILELFADSKRRKELGKAAKIFIHESYSWNYRAEQVLRQIIETTNWENKKEGLL